MLNQKRFIVYFILGLTLWFLSLLSASCLRLASIRGFTPTPTNVLVVQVSLTPTPTDTPTGTPTATATVTPTPSDTPTVTPTPTETLTPTPRVPSVVVNASLYVRVGPGTGYETLSYLNEGTRVNIIGQNFDGTWWQIPFASTLDGKAWISAAYGEAEHTDIVPIIDSPPPPTSIPPPPDSTSPTPTPSAETPVSDLDFVVKSIRLWSNEENGGISPDGSVTNCGYGHNIFVAAVDPSGAPLDGVVIGDKYNNPRQITGLRGPGRAEYILYGNGYELLVVEYPSLGRPVTSEISPVLSAKDEEIPIPWLIEAHYCATEAECIERISLNNLCRGHYSYDIVFQRTW